eukprot:scaffold1505_cov256-Pinguiococcus_pyrenoidosus.AAC.25
MEGWSDLMYQIQDGANGAIGALFFVSLIILGSFVMLSLVLAVVEERVAHPLASKDDATPASEAQLESVPEKDSTEGTPPSSPPPPPPPNIRILVESAKRAMARPRARGKEEAEASEQGSEQKENGNGFRTSNGEGRRKERKDEGLRKEKEEEGRRRSKAGGHKKDKEDGYKRDREETQEGPEEDAGAAVVLPHKEGASKANVGKLRTAVLSATTRSTRLKVVPLEEIPVESDLKILALRVLGSSAFAHFMNLAILANTLVLAMDRYPMAREEERQLGVANMVLTLVFLVEFVLMIYALGLRGYCADRLNIFDGFIVIVSVLELLLELLGAGGGGGGISALRSFRMFRVLKLAREWKSLQTLLAVFGNTVLELGNFFVLLALFLFIYALLGMQFLANRLRFDARTEAALALDEGPALGSLTAGFYEPVTFYRPRAHFDTLEWSATSIFQVLTGENWNAVMYDAWRSTQGWASSLYFVTLVWFGQLIMMSLFMALLLCNFNTDDTGTALSRSDASALTALGHAGRRFLTNLTTKARIGDASQDAHERGSEARTADVDADKTSRHSAARLGTVVDLVQTRHELDKYAEERCRRRQPAHGKLSWLRRACLRVIDHPRFESGVMVLIVLSSVALALDDPLKDTASPQQRAVYAADLAFTALFTLELVLKVLALGVRGYLGDVWNGLDAFVVLISLVNVSYSGAGPVKGLRALRALRPLRMISRFEELKLIVDALVLSVPGMLNIVFICTLFLLIFAIFGVSYLKGVFYACAGDAFFALPGDARHLVQHPPESWQQLSQAQQALFSQYGDGRCVGDLGESAFLGRVTSRTICECLLGPGAWRRTVAQNFDNVGNAMALLYEISSTEGWVDVMYAAVDNRGIEMQPVEDSARVWIAFFVLFMFVGWAFVMNLFVGQLISSFNALSRRGVKLRSAAQEHWARTQKLVLQAQPEPLHVEPQQPLRRLCFRVAQWRYLEPLVMSCILLNTLVLGMAWFRAQDVAYVAALDVLNLLFAVVFTLEAVVKMAAYGRWYFRDTWNKFDLAIVLGTGVGVALRFGSDVSIGPVASVVRIFRVGRVFRLIRSAKNLRKLFNTLISAVPVCANVFSVVALVFFIAAVVAVQLFARVQPDGQLINEQANFQSFGTALLTLVRFSTGENWNGFMYALEADRDGCEREPGPCQRRRCEPTECGSAAAKPYFYLFTLVVTFVLINLFIAVVLDAFDDSEESELIEPQHIDAFVRSWQQPSFDPNASGYIAFERLGPFLQILDRPMGFGCDYHASDRELEEEIRKLHIPVLDERGFSFYSVLNAVTRRMAEHALSERGQDFEELPESDQLRKFVLKRIGISTTVKLASSLRDRRD